ncbi:SEA/GATOR complex protein SEA2/WDR24 [Microdochium nivale]|nr:SEA/GATOR complex protein SEA2/WDR24 [Microdochium nivale]
MYNQGKIMRRLLGRPTTESPSSTSNEAALGVTSSPTVPLSYRPYASQTAVYPAGDPIACIDRSADGNLALLGGRHILQTVHLDGLQFKKGVDVRAAIGGQPAGKASAAASVADQFSIKDAKLSTSSTGSEPSVFTACANGKIFIYDLNRLGSGTGPDFIQAREDSRQVNKLDFNPHRGNWLLAGGQDGVVRCFDVKAPVSGRSGPTFRTFQSFRCNAEGIRDVKWSPKEGMIFACATESGVVLKWDIRKHTTPLLKINAHDTQAGVTSISWHPDGDHLISAGLDSKCHVWDLSKNAEKRQKPKWTVSAPAPVTSVSWRPALWSATAQGKRAAQIVVSYDEGGNTKRHGINSVHIWDLARPTMPFKEISIFDRCPSALLWHDQDLLWTVGQDGIFAQCDVAYAPKVIDRQPLSNLHFSAKGEVLMLLEERARPARPRPMVSQEQPPTSSYSSSPTGPMLSISRSDSEEDVMASFLAPKRRGHHRRRTTLSRPTQAQSMSTTPPSGSTLEDNAIPLDQAIRLTGIFKSQQVMAVGHVPAASKAPVYEFMASQYLEILRSDLPHAEGRPSLDVRVTQILEQYARAAETMSQFRLAQTWRILSYAMGLLLTRRSQFHLEVRTTGNGKRRHHSPASDYRSDRRGSSLRGDGSSYGDHSGEAAMRKGSILSTDSRQSINKSLLSEELESESNLPTPLARPVVEESTHNDSSGARRLTPVLEIGSFTLPPAAQAQRDSPRKRLDSTPLSEKSHDSQLSSLEGYDFYDVDTVRDIPDAIDVPKKKEPLSLDYVNPKSSVGRRRTVARQDSDDSFAQMFSVSDGSRQTSVLTSASDGNTHRMHPSSQIADDGQDAYDGEYGSRIRGHKIDASPDGFKRPSMRPKREGSGSSREDFMISQTTIDTLDSDVTMPSDASFPVRVRTSSPHSARRISEERTGVERPENHQSPTITETDFLPWTDDPPFPYPLLSDSRVAKHAPPIEPYDLVKRAMAHESKHSALHASAVILLLKPLVPDDVIDSFQAMAILRQHHSRLMSMSCFVEAALLRNLCVQDWPDGLDMWGDNYTAVFLPAQERVSAPYICATCHKPREVNKSEPNGQGIWKCERCQAVMGPCAVCGHRNMTAGLAPPTPVPEGVSSEADTVADVSDTTELSTWWYCPGCAHGGHAACLQQWHAITGPGVYVPALEHHTHKRFSESLPGTTAASASSRPGSRPASRPSSRPSSRPASPVPSIPDYHYPEMMSDGCCPLDGCGHACLPGRWRNELLSARTEELGRAVREQTRGMPTGSAAASFSGGGGIAVPVAHKSGGGGISERRFSGSADSSAVFRPSSLGSGPFGGSGMGGGGSGGVVVRGEAIDYVAQSRAVDSVRETLGKGTGSGSLGVTSAAAVAVMGSNNGAGSAISAGSGFGLGGGGGGGGGGGSGGSGILSSSPANLDSPVLTGVLRTASSSISAGNNAGGGTGTGTGTEGGVGGIGGVPRERRKSVKFAGPRGAVLAEDEDGAVAAAVVEE